MANAGQEVEHELLRRERVVVKDDEKRRVLRQRSEGSERERSRELTQASAMGKERYVFQRSAGQRDERIPGSLWLRRDETREAPLEVGHVDAGPARSACATEPTRASAAIRCTSSSVFLLAVRAAWTTAPMTSGLSASFVVEANMVGCTHRTAALSPCRGAWLARAGLPCQTSYHGPMKTSGACPKCACTKIYVVDEVRQPDVDSANVIVPLSVSTFAIAADGDGVKTGNTHRTTVGTFEAWISRAAGSRSWYAKNVGEAFERILALGRKVHVRVVERAGRDRGRFAEGSARGPSAVGHIHMRGRANQARDLREGAELEAGARRARVAAASGPTNQGITT